MRRSPRNIPKNLFFEIEREVPVIGGLRRYIDFDNAASTPALRSVVEKITQFLPWYGNVHRGAGFKSKLSSWAFEQVRARVARFAGADPERQVVLFSRNTTESINQVAQLFPFRKDGVVVTTEMEHHSNLLPWRRVARTVQVPVTRDGRVDEQALHDAIQAHRDNLQLVAVTAASNVTGFINPIHRWARWAHEAGADILVDAAQLAPHRPMVAASGNVSERLDFVAFSAHKMYAPFGLGVLIADRQRLSSGEPRLVGGGSVTSVGLDETRWAALPEREEAGTPAVVGAVALGAAIGCLEEIGWDAIIRHEQELTGYALQKLAAVPGIRIYGESDPARSAERLGVIAFRLNGRHHSLVSEILSSEWGIGTRSGKFCAHPYVRALLKGLTDDFIEAPDSSSGGGCADAAGLVRVSFGLHNTLEEVDTLCDALTAISTGNLREKYRWDEEIGFIPRGWTAPQFDRFFTL